MVLSYCEKLIRSRIPIFGQLLLVLLLVQTAAGVETRAKPLPVDQAFQLSYTLRDQLLLVNIRIADGYYLYKKRTLLQDASSGDPLPIAAFNSVITIFEDEYFGRSEIMEKNAALSFDLAGLEEQDKAVLIYQGCQKDGLCYLPVRHEISLADLRLNPTYIAALANPSAQNPSRSGKNSQIAGIFDFELTKTQAFLSNLEGGRLWQVFLLFFLAGLLLSFAPCNLPMIPIFLRMIIGSGGSPTSPQHSSPPYALALGTCYTLSMASTYALIGALAGVLGANLQYYFQQEWMTLLFAGVMLVLALPMFGVFSLRMPAAWQGIFTAEVQSNRSPWGKGVLLGVSAALIAGPCLTAPLAGALLFIGNLGSPVLGAAALFAMGVGIGLPLLVVAYYGTRALPYCTPFVQVINPFFGVALLLTAVWFLNIRLLSDALAWNLAGVVLVVFGVVMAWRQFRRTGGGNNPSVATVFYAVYLVIFFVGGVVIVREAPIALAAWASPKQQGASDFAWVDTPAGLAEELQAARRAQMPVMIDVYADWCVSCKAIKDKVFPKIAAELAQVRVIVMDLTENTPEVRAMLQELRVIGPPTFLFFTSAGQRVAEAELVGYADLSDFEHSLSFVITDR